MNPCLPIALVFMLAGCGTVDLAGAGGAKAMDEALKRAEWVVCKAASIGAVQRRYKGRTDAYRAFCRPKGSVIDGETGR